MKGDNFQGGAFTGEWLRPHIDWEGSLAHPRAASLTSGTSTHSKHGLPFVIPGASPQAQAEAPLYRPKRSPLLGGWVRVPGQGSLKDTSKFRQLHKGSHPLHQPEKKTNLILRRCFMLQGFPFWGSQTHFPPKKLAIVYCVPPK